MALLQLASLDLAGWVLTVIALLLLGVVSLAVVRFLSRDRLTEGEQPSPHPPATTDASVRQASVRRSALLLRVFVTGQALGAPPEHVEGWVLYRSRRGLCLTVGRSVEPGTALRVRPCDAPESKAWTSLVVRYCRLEGGCWELGCRFVQ